MYYIYGIYDTINGSLYIGLTNNLTRRWNEHIKNSKVVSDRKRPLYQAMSIHGVDNFIFKQLDLLDDLSEARLLERTWIRELRVLGYLLYNMTEGGERSPGERQKQVWSPDRRKKLSERMSGKNNHMYGIQLFGPSNGHYGKKMKQHVKDILREANSDLTWEQVEKIRQLYATGNYTQTELAKQFGLHLPHLHRIIKYRLWDDGKKSPNPPKPRLKIEDVQNIRQLYRETDCTQQELAERFNVSVNQIHRIIRNRKWIDPNYIPPQHIKC